MHRRKVLKYGFLSSVIILFNGFKFQGTTTLYETIKILQYDLIPKAKDLNIDTVLYMQTIFNHSKISKEDKKFLKNGVKWLNEEALKKYGKKYIKLTKKEREKLLKVVSNSRWGESFLSEIMSYTFEAMFGDPVYGANINEAGWKWLNFKGGEPRPKKAFL